MFPFKGCPIWRLKKLSKWWTNGKVLKAFPSVVPHQIQQNQRAICLIGNDKGVASLIVYHTLVRRCDSTITVTLLVYAGSSFMLLGWVPRLRAAEHHCSLMPGYQASRPAFVVIHRAIMAARRRGNITLVQ